MKFKITFLAVFLVVIACETTEQQELLNSDNHLAHLGVKAGTTRLGIEIGENEILITVPSHTDLSNISMEYTIPEFAAIDPNPESISSLEQPLQFTITAEDGSRRTYTVRIIFEKSPENKMLSFSILNNSFGIEANIDQEKDSIYQKLPPSMDLNQIQAEFTISDFATIEPDPQTITDYSQPVLFTITAENGDPRVYTVKLSSMTNSVQMNCETDNASHWFGGDDRESIPEQNVFHAPRNVGVGQEIRPGQDLNVTGFSVHFQQEFTTTSSPKGYYFGESELRLDIRTGTGKILASTNTMLQHPLTSLWITFDLEPLQIILKEGRSYYFTWYLTEGEELGIMSGATGNQYGHSSDCDGNGLRGNSRIIEETNLGMWESWSLHSWHFNFRLEGNG